MSLVQRFFLAVLPKSWSDDMRTESQSWRIRCTTCDASVSLWDVGGIRWKAASRSKRTLARCSHCGGYRWAAIERTPTADVALVKNA